MLISPDCRAKQGQIIYPFVFPLENIKKFKFFLMAELKLVHVEIKNRSGATSGKVMGSRPNEVNYFFQFLSNPSNHTRPWGLPSL
jgi:hypothetical protein